MLSPFRPARVVAAAAAGVLTLVSFASPAHADDLTIGGVADHGIACVGSLSLISLATADTPATASRVTSWTTIGASYNIAMRTLQVWRPIGDSQVELVYTSPRVSSAFDGVRTFPLTDGFVMRPGDRLGLQVVTDGYDDGCGRFAGGSLALTKGVAQIGDTETIPSGVTVLDYYLPNVSVALGSLDTTAPVITPRANPTSPDGSNGWYAGAPSVSFDVSDPDSAITSTTGCDSATVPETAGLTYTCTAASAGGTSTGQLTVKRDSTAPTATLSRITDGTSYVWGSVPVASCTAADSLSGPDGCTVSGGSTAVGTHVVTGTAMDVAGNAGTSTARYTVLPWRTDGFRSPVDMGMVNTVKAGSTIPVKFSVHAGATEITDPTQVAISAVRSSCGPGATTDAVEVVGTGETTLRYDADGQQFVHNWKTPRTAGTCYALTLTTPDGTTTTAHFLTR